MGDPKGFMTHDREVSHYRPVSERLAHWREFTESLPVEGLQTQGARCMDCGIPFCHKGCPLGNVIPDFNDLVYRGQWRAATERLHATNNFPEFTGRLCPAPCESSCVLGLNRDPVTIKQIERAIIDRAWAEGWITPQPPKELTGKTVAIIGSGPAGMACAQQLARVGHKVTLYERSDAIGGLMRYGIPEFKMEKANLDRRIEQMSAEGVEFVTNAHIGVDLDAAELRAKHDAAVLCGGASAPRDLPIPGRELEGIYFAVPFLTQATRRVHGLPVPAEESVTAEGKHVIIIGGGDTGSDCLGTSRRQGATEIHQFEIVPQPPEQRDPRNPWPQWDNVLRISSSHEEVGPAVREFKISTTKFSGDEAGHVRSLETVEVNMEFKDGRLNFVPVPGTEKTYQADLVLLAMGFVGPERGGLLDQLGVALDGRGNVAGDADKMTNVDGVFAAGDMARGQSLIVWAIAEGRHAAHGVDQYLMGSTQLPKPLAFGEDARPFG